MIAPDSGGAIIHLLMGREIWGHLAIYYTYCITAYSAFCVHFAFLKKIALLRYNLHTIMCTHLKYTVEF